MTDAPKHPAPPHCPNPACYFHKPRKQLWHYVRIGTFSRQTAPLVVQRYRCGRCRRTFSDQTFLVTYWLKRPDLVPEVFHGLVACSAYRQIAPKFKASHQTVARQSERLGRHCLLFHQRHRPRGVVREPLAADSFESFEYSQYHPTSHHVAAGMASHFFYGFTESELRRKGTMTKGQKRRRAALEERLGKPDPKSIEKEFAALLEIVAPTPQVLELHTDEHPAYPRAIRRLGHLQVRHATISSRAARTQHNPLFPINLLDLLLRHNGSNHKRETIAFSKRRASAAERMAVFLVWRNWMRPFSVRIGGPSPAMKLGIADRIVELGEVLKQRLFPGRIELPERWQKYYTRAVMTRAIPNGRRHRLKYAF